LNDLLFCERRCALHRIENVWVDNAFTLEGTHGHKRADRNVDLGVRGGKAVHAVLLKSDRLRLSGKADVIEFHSQVRGGGSHGPGIATEVPYPIEYKRGKRRRWDND